MQIEAGSVMGYEVEVWTRAVNGRNSDCCCICACAWGAGRAGKRGRRGERKKERKT
jgi:hypothetical protein